MSIPQLTKLDITLLILFLLALGAYFGCLFSDNAWKKDIITSEKTNTIFKFGETEYVIQKYNSNTSISDYQNTECYNVSTP